MSKKEAVQDKKTYSVGELSKLSGVSVRTLHVFEEKGLLQPDRSQNGYRIYSEKDIERLHVVLIYRALHVPLAEIASMIDSPDFHLKQALVRHLDQLEEEKKQIEKLIDNVKFTIESIERKTPMSDKERFEAFKKDMVEENEKQYGEEIRERWGDKVVDAFNEHIMSFTEDDFASQTQIEECLKEEIIAGLKADDEGIHAKRAAQLHALWLKKQWPEGLYSPEAHKGLAEAYLSDERFQNYYNAWAPEACSFLVHAIQAWVGKE